MLKIKNEAPDFGKEKDIIDEEGEKNGKEGVKKATIKKMAKAAAKRKK